MLYVFVLPLRPFLFAGWYWINRPMASCYSWSFVNTVITYILLPLIIFAGFSLPNDIRVPNHPNRSDEAGAD